jgi:hypothetical protein
MDFIVGLPPTQKGHNSIWVIVDRLTKSAHFILVHSTYRPSDYAELYFSHIVKLHGVPHTIIEVLSSLLASRNIYINSLVQSGFTVQPTILKPLVKLSV